MSFWRRLLGRNRRDVWRQLASDLDGRFIDGGLLGTDVVQVTRGDWILTLDVHSGSEETPTYTRVRAPFANLMGFHFRVVRSGPFSGLARLLGMQDVEVGHASFDRRFVIKSNSEARAQRLFDDLRIRQLLMAERRFEVEVRDHEGWTGPRFPEGVDELRFMTVGVVDELARLRGMFELCTALLERIDHGGEDSEDAVQTHIRRLRGPGGSIRSGDLLLWDGDTPRHLAAEALARLKDARAIGALTHVLDGNDHGLRAKAIMALREIGSHRAVGPLVRQLGDSTLVHGEPVGDYAAAALTVLGEPELAAAVRGAVRGDATRLAAAVGPHRPQVIDALSSALKGPTRRYAARALSEIHAVEALPALREAWRTAARRSDGDTIQAVIRALEARAGLPRPAAAENRGVDTLPRPSGAPTPPRDSLPRAAGPED